MAGPSRLKAAAMPDDRDCPFPGMDPFIEGQRWAGFHDTLLTDLSDALGDRVPDRYVVDVQDRVVLATDFDGEADGEVSEVTLFGDATVRDPGPADGDGGAAVAARPGTVLLTLPEVDPREERFVEVREADTGRLVTVIELLSPKNKRGEGRDAYLRKRNALILSDVHLVEIDLLRAGRRLPTREPQPSGDYFAHVSHAEERPRVRVTAWDLPDELPTVAVPLHPRDGESFIDLARLTRERYARGNYRRKLNYTRPPVPPLAEDRAAWVAERLAAAGLP